MRRHNTNLLHRTGHLLVAASVVAVLAVAFPLSASAGPAGAGAGAGKGNAPGSSLDTTAYGRVPAGFSSWAEVLKVQAKLNAAAERINSAPGAQANLAGIVARPESRRLK